MTKNYRIGVDYQLYSVADGKDTLEEKTDKGEPFRFLSGFGMVLDDFEKNIAPLEIGGAFDFTLTPEQAYGEYDERGLIEFDREMFSVEGKFDDKNVAEGRMIWLNNSEGRQFPGLVLATEPKVRIDLNHPLAGKTLHFVGTVVEREEATAEEIQAMAAHLAGEGGCGGDCGSCGGCGGGHCGGCQ